MRQHTRRGTRTRQITGSQALDLMGGGLQLDERISPARLQDYISNSDTYSMVDMNLFYGRPATTYLDTNGNIDRRIRRGGYFSLAVLSF